MIKSVVEAKRFGVVEKVTSIASVMHGASTFEFAGVKTTAQSPPFGATSYEHRPDAQILSPARMTANNPGTGSDGRCGKRHYDVEISERVVCDHLPDCEYGRREILRQANSNAIYMTALSCPHVYTFIQP